MDINSQTLLTTIPGADPRHRLSLVLCHRAGAGTHIEMQQQTWGDGVGWFTQSTVELEPDQVAQLRNALGAAGGAAGSLRPAFTRSDADHPQLRVVTAESA